MQISPTKRVSLTSQQSEKPQTAGQKSQSKLQKGRLSRAHYLTIGLLVIANIFATVTFSCIVPFFPTVAIQQKELSTAQVGSVIGVFQLVIFLVSPFIGKKIGFLGPYRSFSCGILLSAISTITFGFAYFLPSGIPFFVGILAVRSFQALGSAAFTAGSWAIVGRLFPTESAQSRIHEVAYCIGISIGPAIGSALYELGGYIFPLAVVGFIQLLVFLLSLLLNWASFDADQTSTQISDGDQPAPGIFQILFIPDVFMVMLSLFVECVAWTFYEPDLANHLSTFSNWSVSTLVGLMMSVLSISYLIFAPIWGFLMDRYLSTRTTSVMIFGGLFVIASCLLMGPAPFLGLKKSLVGIGISYVLLGFASAVLYIPVFKWCVDAAKRRGFEEKSPALCGLISGFFQSTVSLGCFLGTFLGGLSAQNIGFQWTAAGVAGIELIQISIQLIYGLVKRMKRKSMTQRISPTF